MQGTGDLHGKSSNGTHVVLSLPLLQQQTGCTISFQVEFVPFASCKLQFLGACRNNQPKTLGMCSCVRRSRIIVDALFCLFALCLVAKRPRRENPCIAPKLPTQLDGRVHPMFSFFFLFLSPVACINYRKRNGNNININPGSCMLPGMSSRKKIPAGSA